MTSQPILEPILFRLLGVAEVGTLNLDFGVKKCPNRKIIFGTFIYALCRSYQNQKHPVGHIDTLNEDWSSQLWTQLYAIA